MRKKKPFRFKLHVIRGDGSHLLGRNVAGAMGLVKRIVELKEQNNPYPSSDVGLLKIKPVKITLKEKKMQCHTVFQRQDVCLCLCSLKLRKN